MLKDGAVIGLAPLLIQTTKIGDYSAFEASYYGAPLPWPCFSEIGPNFEAIEDFTLSELERRAVEAKAGRIQLCYSPPTSSEKDQDRFSRAILNQRYIDTSFPTHNIEFSADSFSQVRSSFRRAMKKFRTAKPLFD